MNYEKLTNIKQNSKIMEKIKNIEKIEDIGKKYEICQAVLEYINVCLIKIYFNIEMNNYNIINIINIYRKLDEELYNQMMSINCTYNIISENGTTMDEVEYLLLKIDYIYGYIIKKYGNII